MLKTRALSCVAAACLLLAGCSSSTPQVEVEASPDISPWTDSIIMTVKVKSLVDAITVEEVKVNRGNCKPHGHEPKAALKFGQVLLITYPESCDVSQVDVTTDKGAWSFRL